MAGDLNRESRQQRNCSLFDLPRDFFDSARLVSDIRNDSISQLSSHQLVEPARSFTEAPIEEEKDKKKNVPRWSCNTCKVEFESLEEQRSHFKSDFHRFNVKLNVAGKGTIKEEDFDEFTGDSLSKDYEISSISGSEDDDEKVSYSNLGLLDGLRKEGARVKRKVFISLQSGDTVSVWKCMLVDESEDLSFDKNNLITQENCGSISCLRDEELMKLLKCLIHEPRNKTHLRIVLLASGGHFAGCVFDGNSVIIHKTFHRYVIRAKAGKRQSTKDATGKAAKSAGASLRRYNEMALKKEIQELLTAWKPFFDASLCVFLYAPSNNRQLFFDGEKPYFSHHNCRVRHIPFSVRRPTLKEAKRIYLQLTHLVYELDMKGCSSLKEDLSLSTSVVGESNEAYKDLSINSSENNETYSEAWSDTVRSDGPSLSNMSEIMVTSIHINEETPLHEAAMSGNAQQTLELLEQGLNPCVKDSRGRTPYMLATEKEVRNTFRRFMALNLDKWDWHAANVPSPLTEEMEASQAAKQAEKDAKRKAKAKELKKVRKAKEKAQGQAQAAITQSSSTVPPGQQVVSVANRKAQIISSITSHISKEEELKKTQAEEREKRAAAAEKRIAAQKALGASTSSMPQSCSNAKGVVTEGSCSCCMASLAGKIPFHRYHYKYCSTSCMHVHREMLEDG